MYKWIKVYGNTYSESSPGIIVAEMEILDKNRNNLTTGGTPFGGPTFNTSYPPTKAFDGVVDGAYGSMFYASAKPSYLGYYKESGMDAAFVRLSTTTYADYLTLRLVNGIIYGSNDSTNGVDGTWDVLATNVNMASTVGTWTEHALVRQGPKRDTNTIITTIVAALPTTLVRGFR